jgi:hypothetical protein
MARFLSQFAVSGIMVTMLALSMAAFAEDCPMNSTTNPAFDRIKKLAGEWQGTTIAPDTGKEQNVSVRYEVTSGGTSVVEKIFVGAPHEMMSVYYVDGQGVGVTHYCMLGNRPVLSLNKADEKSLAFEMVGTKGIASLSEQHMHGLTLTFDGQDKLRQDWVGFKDNKSSDHVTITLSRK